MQTTKTVTPAPPQSANLGLPKSAKSNPRERLVEGLPVTERRLDLAGVSTALLEGGQGQPIILLHGPGEYAAKWMTVIPSLVADYRVIAPDLPGHGTSVVNDGPLSVDRVLAWLGELIEQACSAAPVVVGQIIGGAVAARFAVDHGSKIRRLVLVDSLGLAPFQPTPEFGRAMTEFMTDPTEDNHDRLWERCAFDLDRLRTRLGEQWTLLKTYNLDRAKDQSLQADQHRMMEQFGFAPIPPSLLGRVSVPTGLIWGRHDLATQLKVAQEVSARYDWPLHVIENAADDPALEQPEAFLEALHAILST